MGRGRVLVVQDDMCASCSSVFDLLKRFRPTWLMPRGTFDAAPDYPQVIADDLLVGGIGELRGIQPRDVRELRLLSAAEANLRYGPGFMSGAIVMTMQRR